MYITGVTTTSSLDPSPPSTLANFGWKKASNNEFIVEFLATWIAMAFFVFATFISLIVLFIKVRNIIIYNSFLTSSILFMRVKTQIKLIISINRCRKVRRTLNWVFISKILMVDGNKIYLLISHLSVNMFFLHLYDVISVLYFQITNARTLTVQRTFL